jgi:molybdopterin molybdotransferase
MLNAKEALETILGSVRPLDTIAIPVQHALGYAIAENVLAGEDIPAFDNSAMDGFAVRSGDVAESPVVLRIAEEIPAGTVATRALERGEAMSIMTGAKIPAGADAVVQVEITELVDDVHVKVLSPITAGHNIRRAGDDVRAGHCVLEKGTRIRPQEIGLLASLGRTSISIYRPAQVAVLATGDELIEIDQPAAAGKVRNSSTYALLAQLHECGAEGVNVGIAGDNRKDLTDKTIDGLAYDVLITTGGVSAGKYDLVMEVLRNLGVETKFWKINMKPGMPMMFATYRGKCIFGLPGNPVSTIVTFLQFVRPALLKMMGHSGTDSAFRFTARMQHEIRKTDGKRHFVRGILRHTDGSLVVCSTGSQNSNLLTSLTRANCLIILPEDKQIVSPGEEVDVELL